MSLLDALLLEGYRDPREIYIALRSDGQRGSGTIDDPYDGGTRIDPALAGSVSLNKLEVIFSTGVAHGFTTSNSVVISGVTGPNASIFNGTFVPISEVPTLNTFKIILGSTPTAPPPPSGDIKARLSTQSDDNRIGVRPYWPVAKVTTSSAHGYGDYEVVTIADAAAPGTLPAALAGTVVIIGADPATTTFYYRLLNPNPPDATVPAAVSGSFSVNCSRLRFRFDEAMRGLPENAPTSVHLGAGTFETRGSASAYTKDLNNHPDSVFVGFLVQQGRFSTASGSVIRAGLGMRVIGSGMEATIVKLVHAVDSLGQVSAFGNTSETPTVSFEASDFTVDCNLFGQPIPAGFQYAPVTVGGFVLGGRLLRISRIRTINFGPQSIPESFANGLTSHYLDPEGAFHNVQEDCVSEKPAESNSHETTILSSAGSVVSANNRSAVVRRCFGNMSYSNGALPRLWPVQDLHRDANDLTLAWLTTTEPHTHVKAKALVVHGALVGGSLNNSFNGTFAIETIVSDTQLTYRMYADPAPGQSGQFAASGTITIGHGISREQLAVKSLRIDSTEGYVLTRTFLDDGVLGDMAMGIADAAADIDPICLTLVDLDAVFTLVTKRPHNRTTNHRVLLFNVGYTSDVPVGTPAPPFNGAYPVLAVDSTSDPLQPDRLLARLPADTPFVGRLVASAAAIGPDFHGIAAVSGPGCVTEGNALYDSQSPFYIDTGTSKELIVRDNYWSDFYVGLNEDFNPAVGGVDILRSAVTLTRDTNDHTLAIFETAAPHYLSPRQAVTIQFAFVPSANPPFYALSPYYNGTFVVESVAVIPHPPNGTDTYTFSYRMTGDPGSDAILTSPPGPPQYQARWQTFHLTLENNVIEGYPTDSATYAAPGGVSTYGYLSPPPYMFPQMIMRDNIIRHRDNQFSTPDSSVVLGVTSMENALIEGNVADLTAPHLLSYLACKNIKMFGNQTPSGQILHPFEAFNGFSIFEIRDDLESLIENITFLAL